MNSRLILRPWIDSLKRGHSCGTCTDSYETSRPRAEVDFETSRIAVQESKRCTSPIPDDPFGPPTSSYVRAEDGKYNAKTRFCSPPPMNIELELARIAAQACSPSLLPGVRPISRELSQSLRDQLVPGKYYAKSMTQYLGPFDSEPTTDELPSGTFFILQKMGRLRETGKSIFRRVSRINVPTRELPQHRPMSPSELPGVRSLNDELVGEARENLVPGKYYAKSMNRYLGPFEDIPIPYLLPAGDSYVILQEMGRLPNGCMIFQYVSQIDR